MSARTVFAIIAMAVLGSSCGMTAHSGQPAPVSTEAAAQKLAEEAFLVSTKHEISAYSIEPL
jgi:hypothetical protein